MIREARNLRVTTLKLILEAVRAGIIFCHSLTLLKLFIFNSIFAGYEIAYQGLEAEHIFDRLKPGTVYQLRVSCSGPGGMSDFSDVLSVTTESVCPGPCEPPRIHGKPRPHSLALKFSKLFF